MKYVKTANHYFGNGVPPGSLLQARRKLSSASARNTRGLHHALHDDFADLKPHIRPDAGREPVMEPGPDAGVRDLVGKYTEVSPTMGNTGRGRAGH